MMALVLQYSNVARNLPKVSYVKGLDIYMFCCIACIFLTLIELAIAGYLERRNSKKSIAERKKKTAETQQEPKMPQPKLPPPKTSHVMRPTSIKFDPTIEEPNAAVWLKETSITGPGMTTEVTSAEICNGQSNITQPPKPRLNLAKARLRGLDETGVADRRKALRALLNKNQVQAESPVVRTEAIETEVAPRRPSNLRQSLTGVTSPTRPVGRGPAGPEESIALCPKPPEISDLSPPKRSPLGNLRNRRTALRSYFMEKKFDEDEAGEGAGKSRWKGDDVDQLCQKLFPGVFIVLNGAYWWYYTGVAAKES